MPALTRVTGTPRLFAFSSVLLWNCAKACIEGLLSISVVQGAPYSDGKKVTKLGDLETASSKADCVAKP